MRTEMGVAQMKHSFSAFSEHVTQKMWPQPNAIGEDAGLKQIGHSREEEEEEGEEGWAEEEAAAATTVEEEKGDTGGVARGVEALDELAETRLAVSSRLSEKSGGW